MMKVLASSGMMKALASSGMMKALDSSVNDEGSSFIRE